MSDGATMSSPSSPSSPRPRAPRIRVRVRWGRAADLAGCRAFDRKTPARILARCLAERDVVIAELAGERVGYLRLERLWARLPYIALVMVAPEHRGRGVGAALLAFVESRLAAKGHDLLLSSSQTNEPRPQAWHRRMGFEECGRLRSVNRDGSGEVFFAKRLPVTPRTSP